MRNPPSGHVYQVWLKRASNGARARPTRCSPSTATATAPSTSGSVKGVDHDLVTSRAAAAARPRPKPVIRRRRLVTSRGAVASLVTDGDLLPPPRTARRAFTARTAAAPICPDCMTPTPVGMRCPECSQAEHARCARSARTTNEPRVTYALIAINVIVFLAERQFGVGGHERRRQRDLQQARALSARPIADGDYWRLVTSGFLHAGLLHIVFNMYLLYLLGQMLEPAIGSVRFALDLLRRRCSPASLGALIARPDARHGRRLGRGLRPDGRRRVELRARGHQPVGDGHRRPDPLQPGVQLRLQRASRSAATSAA